MSWLVYMIRLTSYCFPSVSESQHFLMPLLVFSNSNILIVLTLSYAFLQLGHSIGAHSHSHVEILKRCIPENNLFGQNYHTIKFLNSFLFCTSLITLHTYDTYSFLLLYLSFHVFSTFIAND